MFRLNVRFVQVSFGVGACIFSCFGFLVVCSGCLEFLFGVFRLLRVYRGAVGALGFVCVFRLWSQFAGFAFQHSFKVL